jgi:hypothetical protein
LAALFYAGHNTQYSKKLPTATDTIPQKWCNVKRFFVVLENILTPPFFFIPGIEKPQMG